MTPEPGGSVPADYIALVQTAHPDFGSILAANPGVPAFDLEDMMDDEETALRIRNHGYFESQKRRNFGPRQVREIGQIIPGRKYWLATVLDDANDKGRVGFIVIKGEPYQDREGSWWVDCDGYRRYGNTSHSLDKISLADNSITPRMNGMWSAWNWLEVYGKAPKSNS